MLVVGWPHEVLETWFLASEEELVILSVLGWAHHGAIQSAHAQLLPGCLLVALENVVLESWEC